MSFGLSDWMKQGTPIAYTRISDNDQDKTSKSINAPKKKPILIKQFKFINRRLKDEKMPEVKSENWFAEVGSGTNRNRGQWRNAIRRAVALAAERCRVVLYQSEGKYDPFPAKAVEALGLGKKAFSVRKPVPD